jgi:hypothetical protein
MLMTKSMKFKKLSSAKSSMIAQTLELEMPNVTKA